MEKSKYSIEEISCFLKSIIKEEVRLFSVKE